MSDSTTKCETEIANELIKIIHAENADIVEREYNSKYLTWKDIKIYNKYSIFYCISPRDDLLFWNIWDAEGSIILLETGKAHHVVADFVPMYDDHNINNIKNALSSVIYHKTREHNINTAHDMLAQLSKITDNF